MRKFLDTLPHSEASHTLVKRYEKSSVPDNGPLRGELEFDLSGDISSTWNQAVIQLAVELASEVSVVCEFRHAEILKAVRTNYRYRRTKFAKDLLNEPPTADEVKRMKAELNTKNRRNKVSVQYLFTVPGLRFRFSGTTIV